MHSNTKINEGYSSPEIKTSENIIQNLPLKSLVPMELSVRLTIDEAEIEALAESIKIHGVLEPLLVRPTHTKEGKFEIVCGNRRFMAAQKAGLEVVPCIVKMMDTSESMEAALVENMQRANLSDYELGRWFKLLMEKFPDKYPNQQAVADVFHISQKMVSFLIAHYGFVENVKGELPPNITTRVVKLPERFIREIRRTPEEIQPKIVKAVCRAIDKFECGEEKYAPGVRDVAMLVDSYVKDWERELKAEEELEAKKPEKKKSEEKKPEKTEAPSKPEGEQPTPPSPPKPEIEKPKPPAPSKHEVPSEEEVGARLAEIVRKRKEAEQAKREETLAVTLYKYYPENLMKEVESFCGSGTPLEKLHRLAYYTVEIAWDKLSAEDKMEVLREARSWIA